MIGIATADLSAIAPDEDRPYLEAAFARQGQHARYLQWDDPDVDWAQCDLVVLRSTWDYPLRLPEFLAWLEATSASVPVLNPPAVVRWNCDKRYLSELAAAGAPTVPSVYLTDGVGWADALAGITSSELVVKPAVSGGSRLTGRFARDDPAAAQLAGRIAADGKVAMVQPYQESVGRGGELAALHFGGTFSHAVRKGPILDVGGTLLGGAYQEVVTPAEPSPAELAVAEAALTAARVAVPSASPLLYSRVDLITGDDGAPVLLELELIEPSLFFYALPEPAAAEAADRLATAALAVS